jgi:hypothetical protein
MRRGYTALIIAFLPYVLWIAKFLIEWGLGRSLDSFVDDPGIRAQVVAVMEAYFPYGVAFSLGILLTLTIGYWERIVAKLERLSIWIPSVIRLAVRNIWTRQLVEGGAWLYKGEATKKINGGVITKWGGARIEYWPKDEVHCALDMSGAVWITRKDRTAQTDIKVQYQIFGRLDFWRTIKKMRERDEIGLVIRLKRRERAQKAKAVSKT